MNDKTRTVYEYAAEAERLERAIWDAAGRGDRGAVLELARQRGELRLMAACRLELPA